MPKPLCKEVLAFASVTSNKEEFGWTTLIDASTMFFARDRIAICLLTYILFFDIFRMGNTLHQTGLFEAVLRMGQYWTGELDDLFFHRIKLVVDRLPNKGGWDSFNLRQMMWLEDSPMRELDKAIKEVWKEPRGKEGTEFMAADDSRSSSQAPGPEEQDHIPLRVRCASRRLIWVRTEMQSRRERLRELAEMWNFW
jgi:hypothetical protein